MSLKEEKRQLILEKSSELFGEKGIKDTKVEDITKSLGISKGSFYTYFENKEEVVVEIVKKLGLEWEKTINEINIENEPKEILKEYLIKKAKIFIKNARKINFKNFLETLEMPEVYNKIKEFICKNKNFIKENIVSKYNNSNYNDELMAKFILLSIDEFFWEEILEGKVEDIETYADRKENEINQIVEFIHNGLK